MNPLLALLETVRDELSDAIGLHVGSQIDTRVDDRPVAHSGDVFLGIYPASMTDVSADPEMGLDQSYSINISVTQRTGWIPDDKMLKHAAMDAQKGCLTISLLVTRHMQIRRLKIPNVATGRLENSEWLGQFVEPLKLSSTAISVRPVGPEHFHAEPARDKKSVMQSRDFGLLSVLTFSGARYMENIIDQTQAVMA